MSIVQKKTVAAIDDNLESFHKSTYAIKING